MLFVLAATCQWAHVGMAAEQPDPPLAEGLTKLAAPGNPGPLVVVDEAFAIAGPHAGGTVVAGATWGAGRVVAWGHPAYLDADALAGTDDTRTLMGRSVRWVAARSPGDAGTIELAGTSKEWIHALADTGAHLRAGADDWRDTLHAWLSEPAAPAEPAGRVLVLSSHDLADAHDRELVRSFVHDRGGGLITAGLAWGWLQLNPGQALGDHPGSRLLREAGMAFADGIVDEDPGDLYLIHGPPRANSNADRALDELQNAEPRPAKGDAAEVLESGVARVREALATLPPQHPFHARVDVLLAKESARVDALFATMHERGLRARSHPLALLAIDRIVSREFNAPPRDVRAFAGAAGFPGPVPSDAPREAREVRIDTRLPGWRATGLYAPPGELIRVRVANADNIPDELGLRVGVHLDPATAPPLKRLPRVSNRTLLDAGQAIIANPVGGLIMLEVPAGCSSPNVTLRVEGAVLAPHFVLGTTTNHAWRESIRHHPAPWAELESDLIALSVPSALVRELDDPQGLLELWDRIVRTQAELEPRRIDGLGDRQARYVPDISVSWGYMYAPSHAPLTIPLSAAPVLLDADVLRAGLHGDVWGLYHELGHWHQNDMWTFDGTGEVTVNLFTLYTMDKVCGLPTSKARDGYFAPQAMLQRMQQHAARGSPFEAWKADPFLALTMYVQLQQAFGWDAYRDVFAEYRALPDADRPRQDAQKRDQWLIRMSRRTGRNLGEFFGAWGVPTSAEARTSVASLPAWMPEGWSAP